MPLIDAYALKTFADVRGRSARQEPAPLGDVPAAPQVQGGAGTEKLPDAGRARQMWTLFKPPYRELPGLFSARAVEQHLRLYADYFERARLAEGAPPAERDRLYETDNVAGACLHELFFEGLSMLPVAPSPTLQHALIMRYGNLDVWWAEMVEAGAVAKGWAITSVCSRDENDIAIFSCQSHDHGLPPGYIPLVVADVYEHAYFADHGTDKRRYLETMQRFLNWEALDQRFVHATR